MSNNESIMPQTVGESEDRLREMYAGLTSSSGSVTSLVLNGKSYTNAQLAQMVLAWLNLFVAVNQALSAYKQALSARDAASETIRAFMETFVKAVESQVGSTDQVLEPYGFRTKKEATPLTVQEKAAKVEKTLSTRAKNHTLGKDQKKALDQGATPEPGSSGSGKS
jgi:hypothetical protein